MINRIFILTFVCLLFNQPITIWSQTGNFRVMSYNVENMFDTTDDPDKEDNDFLPEGNRHWTPKRYNHKLQQIARVITAAGEWDTPALIGLCEVENDSVLIHLLNRTPLKRQQYRYCITHGPDRRGINLALLYQRDKFRYISHQSIPIRFSGKKHKTTRDILHVSGEVISGDTLDICICHFPSRYGGEKESEQDRLDASHTLRNVCDSLSEVRHSLRLIIMGDFNDTPENRSATEILASQAQLSNLFAHLNKATFSGSHKYQGEWSQLDQMYICTSMLDPHSTFHLIPESARLFTPDFLLIPDKTWRGMRPFRSYYGFKYEGGFSDHLPILADFNIQQP